MRRFLLLLLAFVLPLQMSWAATHFCDDEGAVKAAVAAAERGDQHDHGGHAGDADQAEKIADACCSAAHGCHGMHSMVAPAEGFVLFSPASEPVAAAPPGLPELDALVRIDRPQWSAA
jgi:hypothetical protein